MLLYLSLLFLAWFDAGLAWALLHNGGAVAFLGGMFALSTLGLVAFVLLALNRRARMDEWVPLGRTSLLINAIPFGILGGTGWIGAWLVAGVCIVLYVRVGRLV